MATRIAVDAMGGDQAPREVVLGAVQAQKAGREVLLVGPEPVIRAELASLGAREGPALRIVHAPDVVAMEEAPSRAVRKRHSSMFVSVDLVRRGDADAVVSAGNSGAMMAVALTTLGRVPGIERPAIATVFLVPGGGETVLLDAGANVDCSPENLLQFAYMGKALSEAICHVAEPRVALLSIGEEDGKGNCLTKETSKLLAAAALRFIGNVEGRQMLTGAADVIVCDGFAGNVALKVAEGTAEVVLDMLEAEIESDPELARLRPLLEAALGNVRRWSDYEHYGGAPLLGVDGVAIIGHGRSNARAVANAIREADEAVENGVVNRIRSSAGLLAAR